MPALWNRFPNKNVIYQGFGEKNGAYITAAVLASEVIAKSIDTLPEDQRLAAREALRNNERGDPLADNIQQMLENAAALLPEHFALSFGFELMGALEGYAPEDRGAYRMRRHMDLVLPRNWQ